MFARDDWTTTGPAAASPDTGQDSPRDNVVFEAGLFGGVLGMRRTFILHARGSNDRGAGYFTTRADTQPGVHARTAGVYWRAGAEDLGIPDRQDDRPRAELLPERLRQWKAIASA